MTWKPSLLLLGCLAPAAALAQTAPSPPSSTAVTDLAPVMVSGVQPGPGLWKVGRGGHVMWVLGVSSPLPEKVRWESSDVEHAIAGAQEVIGQPTLKFKAKVGFFGKLFLLPSIYSARKNADGRTLDEVVPVADYARWTALKARYIGRDHGIERWRPIFAALELANRALKAANLSSSGGVADEVKRLARQYQVPITQVRYEVDVANPRAVLKAFKAAGPDDVACFHSTMVALDTQLPQMAAHANAWATGDIEALRKAAGVEDPRQTCMEAITGAGFARQLGMDDIVPRMRGMWLDAARRALAIHPQSFAMLSMNQLLAPDGYLATLRAEGYEVVAPDDEAATVPVAPAPAASSPAPASSAAR
ncbi:polysaccharide biosynthesis protein GumN [Frateuria sp. Soil773]|uniref:TraB/GumN family protein n=1 Tax=Frateuria sp. Soil773 TaxID=1736407 RepID=UPI0006F5FE40|nr:TraB/GumN family protein [Frateuria sp. Soil773]KRE92405.1 polysaccharide biosynthesis protein GumN [Frateuria sp. Soil773]